MIRTADRKGNIKEEDSFQNNLLEKIYGSVAGRMMIRPLVTPAVSTVVGKLLDSRLSAAAVMVTPLLVRVNSGKPHSASTPDTAWLTADGVMCSRSAAAAKVPSCATMLNSWQSVSVMSCISYGEKNSCDV